MPPLSDRVITMPGAGTDPAPRLGHVLVAYDGTDGADAAASFALWLAGKGAGRVTLVHACPAIESAPTADVARVSGECRLAYDLEWRRRLEALRDYAPEDADVDVALVHGTIAGALIAAARETGADVLFTGSHGTSRMRGALLGSISSQLLSHATCSVMVFRDQSDSPPAAHARTVLVGVDGSPSSREALAFGQALAVPLGAALVLLHVADPQTAFPMKPGREFRAALLRHGRSMIHEARSTVAAPLDLVEEELVEGVAREQLVAACERHSPAILVVGSRGMGGFSELLLGSTSRWVADHAPCPVLVTRP